MFQDFVAWLTEFFRKKRCEGCEARALEIARLMESNRELRSQVSSVIEQQKEMLRDILRLNQQPKQATRQVEMAPVRRVTSIQSRLSEAEKADRDEYNKRLAAELEQGNAVG